MYYLGVDSGGTKAAFLLADESGRVYARDRQPGCAMVRAGEGELERMLQNGVAEVCRKAGIQPRQIVSLALGISGYGEGLGSEEDALSACRAALPGACVACECDTYIGWAGSFRFKPGINIISGTGSIAFGVNEKGESARAGGWDAGLDEGSCSWLGLRLVEAYTKQADGRMPRTRLYDMFRERFHITGEDWRSVYYLNREIVNGGRGLAPLQMLLYEIWQTGDPHAAAIYRLGAQELWMAARAVAHTLCMDGKPYMVSYSGGLFNTGECALSPLRALAQEDGARIVAPLYEPDVGAVLTAIRRMRPEYDLDRFNLQEA